MLVEAIKTTFLKNSKGLHKSTKNEHYLGISINFIDLWQPESRQ